jgi:hypothetical protein
LRGAPCQFENSVQEILAMTLTPPAPQRQAHFSVDDYRACCWRDCITGALGMTSRAVARSLVDRLDSYGTHIGVRVWPATAAEWSSPFGQWLVGFAPFLDNPDEIIGRQRAALDAEPFTQPGNGEQ